MKPTLIRFTRLLVIISLLTSGCSLIKTASSPTPVPPSATPVPTGTPLPSTDTPTPAPPTETPTPEPTKPTGPLNDSAEFITDVTIPDYTVLAQNEPFTKTWRLRNNGNTTWTTAYSIAFVKGDQMGAPNNVPLTQEVPPGETVDLSVPMTAPGIAGRYLGLWFLRNAEGNLFGVGTGGKETFYLIIEVGYGVAASVTPTTSGTTTPGTPAPTQPPTGGEITVTEARLTVDKATHTGACPVTINLTGTITSTGAGSYVYQIEAGSSTPGFDFNLPGPLTAYFPNGGTNTLNIAFSLEIRDSVDAWARLYISSPDKLRSSDVTFKVTCQE